MTFIDWSDREEMVGLLVEYVTDEKIEAAADKERAGFLENLAEELGVVADKVSSSSADETIQMLRRIFDSQPAEFTGDAVLSHLEACIEELVRIQSQEVT